MQTACNLNHAITIFFCDTILNDLKSFTFNKLPQFQVHMNLLNLNKIKIICKIYENTKVISLSKQTSTIYMKSR